MTVRTGKSGSYHYYVCNNRVNRGASACDLKGMSRDALDGVVLTALEQRVLEPEHLGKLLAGLLDRSEEADARRRKALGVARAGRTEAQKALTKPFILVEKGDWDASEPTMRERLALHRARIVTLDAEIASLQQQLGRARQRITPELIERFGRELAARLRTGNPDFRRAYVALLVDRVTVSNDVIHITGSKSALEHALASSGKGRHVWFRDLVANPAAWEQLYVDASKPLSRIAYGSEALGSDCLGSMVRKIKKERSFLHDDPAKVGHSLRFNLGAWFNPNSEVEGLKRRWRNARPKLKKAFPSCFGRSISVKGLTFSATVAATLMPSALDFWQDAHCRKSDWHRTGKKHGRPRKKKR